MQLSPQKTLVVACNFSTLLIQELKYKNLIYYHKVVTDKVKMLEITYNIIHIKSL